jgi:hypothetical protein
MPEQIQEATAAPLALMLKQRFRSPERARNLRSDNTSIYRYLHRPRRPPARNSCRAIRTQPFNIRQQATCGQRTA